MMGDSAPDAIVVDDDERALLASTLAGLAATHAGADLTRALDEFGFTDLLSHSPKEAVGTLFGAMGRRALAYEILGAATRMIELATEHVRARVQFGQPVGSFQAVRHRLAEALVACEGAASALALCWGADDQPLAAMLGKSLAGRSARITAMHCQQVLGGIGFTAEHPFHRFMKRSLVLDRLLGSAAELPSQIGTRLTASAIPRLVEL